MTMRSDAEPTRVDALDTAPSKPRIGWWIVGLLAFQLAVLTAYVALKRDIVNESWSSLGLAVLSKIWLQFVKLRSRNWGYVGLMLLLAVGCWSYEAWVTGWANCSLRNLLKLSRSAKTDLIYAGASFLGLYQLVCITSSFGFSYFAEVFASKHFSLNLIGYVPGDILKLFVLLVWQDFFLYWYHRWEHEISWVWQIHKTHHAATELTSLTSFRVHFLDNALMNVVCALPFALMGLPVTIYVGFRLFLKGMNLLRHSNIRTNWGWFGYLVVSPRDHRVHHSTHREHWNKNFAELSPIWDKMFGTWYYGDIEPDEVGVENNPFDKHSFVHDVLLTYRLSWAQLKTSLRKK